ncbi:hypothetical protein BgiBS90_011945, partial [Biomphalaria glabrata]
YVDALYQNLKSEYLPISEVCKTYKKAKKFYPKPLFIKPWNKMLDLTSQQTIAGS